MALADCRHKKHRDAKPRAVPDGFLPNGTRVMWQSSNGTEFPATITAYNPSTYDAVLDDGCDAKGFDRRRFFKIATVPSQGEMEHPPTDCSGDPSSCPDNEGRGCYCHDVIASWEPSQGEPS